MSSFQALTLSLILHIILLFWLSHIDTSVLDRNYENIEVVYRDPVDLRKRQQMVEQVDVPKDQEDTKTEETTPDFFSEKKIRVREQMQARMNGPTKNRSNLPDSKVARREQPQDPDAIGNSNPNQPQVSDWNPGFSSTDDALPSNIRMGDFTALNTDAHLFYTFFARIKDQIRYRWINRVENVIENANPNEIRNKNQVTWQTQIEIVLDSQGKFINGAIMKPSGLSGLDKAAVLAFRDGAPFPNPPKELIKSDGRIYLEYAFYVNWDPSRVVVKRNF